MRRRLMRLAAVGFLSQAAVAVAGRVENGNDLALQFATATTPSLQTRLRDASIGKTCFFRYLHISAIERGVTNGQSFVRMSTREPSSDLRVEFVVRKAESLTRAESLRTNDAVAVTGRVQSMEGATRLIALDPVVVRYKDKHAPVAGKEFLHEVDPRARAGTDTSTGEEVVEPGAAAKARSAEPPALRPKDPAP